MNSSMHLFTFEGKSNTLSITHIMSWEDAGRLAVIGDLRIVDFEPVEAIGQVEVDDMYSLSIFDIVYRTKDGRLFTESCTPLTKWQMKNILPLEEETMI